MNVTVRLDRSELDRLLKGLGERGPIALQRAMNRGMDAAATEATRRISTDLKIAQSEVRKSLVKIPAQAPRNLQASVAVSGRRIPLIAFRARQTKAGVSYDLGQGRQIIHSAFIAIMRSGHRGVWKRTGPKRTPIIELRGPSLPYIFRKVMVHIQRVGKEAFEKEIRRLATYMRTGQGG